MSKTVRIEEEALAFFERELQDLDDKASQGELRAFGKGEVKLIKQVDGLIQSGTAIALKCMQLEVEHPNLVKDDEKDFGDFKDNQFEAVSQKFSEKEDDISKIHSEMQKLSLKSTRGYAKKSSVQSSVT